MSNNVDFNRNYLYYLSEKLKRINYTTTEAKLANCIKIIEKENRQLIWRLIEYVMCGIDLIFFQHRHTLTDYSVGRYQIKISLMLDFYNIEFSKKNKTLILNKDLKSLSLFSCLKKVNDEKVIEEIIKKEFSIDSLNNLNEHQIYDIALFYSRNIEFVGDLNYYVILSYLYNNY